MLARELVGSKKAKNRMHESKAQMNSVSMQLKENLAMAKMAGCLRSVWPPPWGGVCCQRERGGGVAARPVGRCVAHTHKHPSTPLT